MYKDIIGAIRHEHCCARENEVLAERDLDENAKQRHMNYAIEHYQVEEWLKELKAIKDSAVFYSNRPIEDIVLEARVDAINECINILNNSIPLVDNMDITFGFKCAIERLRLEQLKEQNK